MRRKANFLNAFNPHEASRASCARKFPLHRRANHGLLFARPALTKRGASRSSRVLARDAMDALASPTSDAQANERNRVVPIPRRWNQPPGQEPGGMAANKPGTPGRSRISRKPLRRESRRCSGSPVVPPPCFLLHGAHGCNRHPAFPAPSDLVRDMNRHNSGKSCRENEAAYLVSCRGPSFETPLRGSSG
jgi:hypothetical protein